MSLPGNQGKGRGRLAITEVDAAHSKDSEIQRTRSGSAPDAPGDDAGLSVLAQDLGRLILLYRDNERLLERQTQLRAQIAEAMTYWRREDANRGLAWARLSQLRVRHQAVLAHLRANRVMAHEILDRTGERRDERAAS